MGFTGDSTFILFLSFGEKIISNGIFYLTYIAIVLCIKKDFSNSKLYKINEVFNI